ncbi:MAG: hypothetical protein ABIC40_04070, partial [bacterium]
MITKIIRIGLPLLVIAFYILGCSGRGGNGNPVLPDSSVNVPDKITEAPLFTPEIPVKSADNENGRSLWGFWNIIFNTDTGKFEILKNRNAEFHLNLITQLQKPMPQGLSISVNNFKPSEGLLDINLSITHPFPNSNLRVFDCRGIVMGPGDTLVSKADSGIVFNRPDAFRLENADGYTRWWNAKEFTTPGLFGFNPGVLGLTDYKPPTTLNPYKYFSDPLTSTSPVTPDVNISNRGTFSTTLNPPKLTRNYVLRFPVVGGSPLIMIQYAIDGNWVKPNGNNPVPEPIEDYPAEANCPEAYHIDVKTVGTTAYFVNGLDSGGDIALQIEVFDWGAVSNPGGIDGEIESISIES